MISNTRAWLALTIVVAMAGALAAFFLSRRDKENMPAPVQTIPEAESPLFEDVTAASGIDFTYRNGENSNHYAILESLGGGVALVDYDGDGLLDIFVTGGGYFTGPELQQIKGHPCKLYKNEGNFKFRDVTAEAGVDTVGGEPWFYSHGCAVGDYNNDGWPDLLVTGYGRLALFRNVKDERTGKRRYQEVTRDAGLLKGHFWSTSAAWADLDGDGYPELYVCQYVNWSFTNNQKCPGYSDAVERDICPPTFFEARPHALFRNNRNGTFTDFTKEAGLHTERKDADYERFGFMSELGRMRLRQTDADRDFGKGLGVVIVDVNGDGKPDIYVANDTTDKFLYLNHSERGILRFEDVAVFVGAAHDELGAPNGSMGVDAADYDGTGRASLFVTNYQNELPALYRNTSEKDLHFSFSTGEAGLGAIGRQYVGFGTGFLDADNDGWEDIVITNGHVIRHPTIGSVRQKPVFFRNQGKLNDRSRVMFADATVSAGGYFGTSHQGRGLAIGDLDNDGRPDIVISHVNEPVTVLRNSAGGGKHWLGITLRTKDHRDIVGAKITLEIGERTLTRFAKSGGSYMSSGDSRHLFGLGDIGTSVGLTIVWPSGKKQRWDGLACDRYWELTADEPAAREMPKTIN